jgi:hypothetical protein
VAGDLLAQLLDRRAEPHDVGGHRQHDWDLHGADGTVVALEVTSHVDPDRVSFWRKGPHYKEMPSLDGTYFVSVKPTADRRKLWRFLPTILEAPPPGIVVADLKNARWYRPRPEPTPHEVLLVSLGVEGIVHSTEGPPAIALTTPDGGAVSPERAVEAAMSEVAANRDKLLDATDVTERHLFVWIDGSAWLANLSMREEPPTASAPDFGKGVDVLWVAAVDTQLGRLSASALWRARSGGSWVNWSSTLSE